MTATLGARIERPTYTLVEHLGMWLLAGFAFVGWGAIPTFSRIPILLVGSIGLGSLFFYTKDQLGRIRVSFPVVILLVWSFASFAWSNAPWRTLLVIETTGPYVLALLCVVSVLPFDLIAKGLLRGLYGSVIFNVASLVLVPGTSMRDENGYRSIRGYFIHKNTMAPFMVMVIVLTLALEKRPAWRRGIVIAAAALILGSLSATGLVGLLLVALLDQIAKRMQSADAVRRTAIVLSSFAGLILVAFLMTAFLETIVGVYGKDVTFTGRTGIWEATWPEILRRPVIGWGLDAVWVGPNEMLTRVYYKAGFVPTHAHNGVIETTLEIGIVGLVLVLWIYFGSVRTMWRYSMHGVAFARAGWTVTILIMVMSFSESMLLGPWLSTVIIFRIVGLRLRAGERWT